MPRWIVIGRATGWNDVNRFGEELRETRNWRLDARTTITSVVALADGRLLAECHAVKKEDFESWLKQKGWDVESLTPIKLVAKTGSIWEIA